MRHVSARSFAIVIAVTVAFAVAAWAGIELTRELGRVAAIWFSNGLLVSALLLTRRSLWPALLAATYAANVAVNFSIGDNAATALGLSFANTLEVSIAAVCLHSRMQGTADLLNARTLLRFFGYAVALAPAISGVLAAGLLLGVRGEPFVASFAGWWAADALGMAIVVPLVLAMGPRELIAGIRSQHALHVFGPLVLLVLVAMLVFAQSTYPILFLLQPPLLWISFRLGFAGTAIGISLCAAISLAFTMFGFGPFMLVADGTAAHRILILQLLLATLILTTYPVCAVVAGHARALREVAASEARFRGLAASSNDIIALTDMNGVWRYMSPAVTTLLGWTPEELVGKDSLHLVHPDDAPMYRRGTLALMGGRESLAGSFRVRDRNGHYVWVETISRALFDANGQQSGWVSNTRDISARKRLDQIKNEFIATVSHELRTPLTAMLGAVGLAASGKFGPVSVELQRLLDLAKTNGERLATLVDDILDFEKVSFGKMSFDLQLHAIDGLLEQAVTAIRLYAESLNITVKIRSNPTHAQVRVDAARFQQLMTKLLSNAVKFSHSGGRVEIAAVVSDERCRISIIDHGRGIPREFRDSLFELFAQADGSDQRLHGGAGLGMAIAKQLTEKMGGTITFESEANVGTTFHLEFAAVANGTAASAS